MIKVIGERGSGKTDKLVNEILKSIKHNKNYVIVCDDTEKMLWRIQNKKPLPANLEIISYDDYLENMDNEKQYFFDDIEKLFSKMKNVQGFGVSL